VEGKLLRKENYQIVLTLFNKARGIMEKKLLKETISYSNRGKIYA